MDESVSTFKGSKWYRVMYVEGSITGGAPWDRFDAGGINLNRCSACGALVVDDDLSLHSEWHAAR